MYSVHMCVRFPPAVHKREKYFRMFFIISSVRSSSVYQGLIEIERSSKATFSNFSNSSDSKVFKRPNMCYIFWKAWDSRISNMTFPCIKCKIHIISKYANTNCLKEDPTSHYIYSLHTLHLH